MCAEDATTAVVVVGEALIDRISDASGRVHEVVGGGPYNAARALAALGQKTVFLGGISTDALGDRIAAELHGSGVSAPLPRRGEATGIAHAVIDAGGSAAYHFELSGSACAAVTVDAVRQVWPSRPPRAVHVGTLGLVLTPLAEATEAVVDALDATTLLFADPNCRPSIITDRTAYLQRLDGVLARADVIKVSTEDLGYITPGVDSLAAARALHQRTRALILFTDGSAGVWVLGPGFEEHLPAHPVAVVDTVGAGDVFGAAWLAWWLENRLGRADVAENAAVIAAAHYATKAAAWTCGRTGAQVPQRADLREQ